MTTQTLAPVAAGTRASERPIAVALAAVLGLGLLFMAGFSPAIALHNAAHDFRHTQNFPCH
ncbi:MULTISPECIES: CbtB domain-containing protein [Methylobacterium]|nr:MULTISPECIES: CbtB domain-containing protein [Methylobacterium]MCX7332993.1 CbtB-domain containing protein [Hyphomicrobiales bacterium]KIU32301.1 cobalt transporter [Methylobacterium radiotolerans]KQS75100.1 cobalt transporter [Methylobacterium sp. Leaf361]KTS10375.1 cobalt transporter [Methylobacterium radiotolerans]KTS49351.1 cobalt transporter [Methylobacterium radiotolerans]